MYKLGIGMTTKIENRKLSIPVSLALISIVADLMYRKSVKIGSKIIFSETVASRAMSVQYYQ